MWFIITNLAKKIDELNTMKTYGLSRTLCRLNILVFLIFLFVPRRTDLGRSKFSKNFITAL